MKNEELALASLTVVMDTREKDIERKAARRSDFEKLGVAVIDHGLNFGDYSAFYTDPVTGEQVDLGKRLVFERKKDIEEFVGSLTNRRRSGFMAELQRATDAGSHLVIAIESGTVSDLMRGKYRTDARASSMAGTLFAMLNRFNISVVWLTPDSFAAYVYGMYRRMVLDDLTEVPCPAEA